MVETCFCIYIYILLKSNWHFSCSEPKSIPHFIDITWCWTPSRGGGAWFLRIEWASNFSEAEIDATLDMFCRRNLHGFDVSFWKYVICGGLKQLKPLFYCAFGRSSDQKGWKVQNAKTLLWHFGNGGCLKERFAASPFWPLKERCCRRRATSRRKQPNR